MKTLGILGLGAFGQLMAKHLAPHFHIRAYDPSSFAEAYAWQHKIDFVPLEEAARSDIVVLATPVDQIEEVVRAIKPHLKTGALVLDIASVKVKPAQILEKELPGDIDIICTHPLFGPQSAHRGISGQKIAVCPLRGERTEKVTAFLIALGLEVMICTPEEHDREVAAVQGLTHMIAKVLMEMEPLPQRMTTTSFNLLMQAVDMVRHDSMELFLAIQRANPYSADVREKFFTKAHELQEFLDSQDK
ncbi:MAG: prephenate dehydrogenase [Alphaproteobacteria bacterium]|nr:prephenate dehydrogenase [Alphaproteobacteria bacterium]